MGLISGFDISVTYLGQHDPNSNGYQTKTTMANCSTLDDFGRLLRAYLKDRGLQHSRFKKKEELVALAFAAYCQDLPVTGISDEKMAAPIQYAELLLLPDGTRLPDPFAVPANEWLSESDGVNFWPPCTVLNISEYLTAKDERPLCSRLRNDYKEGKYA